MKIFKLNHFILFFILCFLAYTSQAQIKKRYLVTSTSFDKITKKTTYKDLLKLYGEDNIQDTFYVGDGGVDDTVRYTIIFENTPKAITIYWSIFHQKISYIETSSWENTLYYTIDGLKVGNTLKKMLGLNKKKITFNGFGWDGGGILTSFNKGKLDKPNIGFVLDYRNGINFDELSGDIELNTDMPLVEKNLINIFINQIKLTFDEY